MTDLPQPDSTQSVDPRVERSRLAVLEAAGELLLADGPDAITHGNVAAAAGVSRTTVYKHYPHRSDLLFATAGAIGKHLPDDATFTGDLRADLRSFLSMLVADLSDDGRTKVMAMMMERALHDDAVALVRDTFMAEIESTFSTLVDAACANGDLRADVDVDRSLAGLAGSLLYARFLANQPIDDALVDGAIENFISANAPAHVKNETTPGRGAEGCSGA